MQTTVLFISLLGILIVSAAFVFVIRHSQEREEDYSAISSSAYTIRRWLMIAVCVVGVLVTFATLTPFPLTAATSAEPRIVKAVSGQWYWQLDDTTATVGEAMQYHVSTVDVNHGFAIYSPDNRIIAQTQAMPGYTNKLNITFHQAGTHLVRCLEYCGLAHHAMIVEIHVSEAN